MSNLLKTKTIYTYKINVKKQTIRCLVDLYENNNHILIKTKLTFDEFLNLVENGYTPVGFNIDEEGYLHICRSQLRPYSHILNQYVENYKKYWCNLKLPLNESFKYHKNIEK